MVKYNQKEGKPKQEREENKMNIILSIIGLFVIATGIKTLKWIASETIKEKKEERARKELERKLAEDWKTKSGVYSYLRK